MSSQDIDTGARAEHGPWTYARKVFVRLLLGGVFAMVPIGMASVGTPLEIDIRFPVPIERWAATSPAGAASGRSWPLPRSSPAPRMTSTLTSSSMLA